MAPNQKQPLVPVHDLAHLVEDGETLLVQPKPFLPLVDGSSPEDTTRNNDEGLKDSDGNVSPTSVNNIITSPTAPSFEGGEYWTWPSSVPDKDIFSAAFLEAGLVAEARRLASKPEGAVTVYAQREDEDDAYWNQPSGVAVYSHGNQAMSERTGYWDWSSQGDTKAAHVALILKEELARHCVSAQRMEERLLEDARTQRHYLDSQAKAENDSYWNWESPTTIRAESGTINESYWEWQHEEEEAPTTSDLVAAILAYEAKRTLFSIEHIQVLESQVAAKKSVNNCSCEEQMDSLEADSYWAWSSPEDKYWDWHATPISVGAVQVGYWDW